MWAKSLIIVSSLFGKVWLRGGRGKAQTQLAEKASLDFFGAGVVRSSPCV